MKWSGIISVAIACGLGGFVYTLVAGGKQRAPESSIPGYVSTFGRGMMQSPGFPMPDDIESLEKMTQGQPGRGAGRTWYALARAYHDAGREDDAIAAWQESLRFRADRLPSNPNDANLWFEVGWAYFKVGKLEEARKVFEQVEPMFTTLARNNPRDRGIWYRLGWSRRIIGNEVEAQIAWSNARDILIPSDGPGGGAEDLYDLACMKALMGDKEGSLASLERSIRAGWSRAGTALHDEDFESIRDDPRFKHLIGQIGNLPRIYEDR